MIEITGLSIAIISNIIGMVIFYVIGYKQCERDLPSNQKTTQTESKK